MVSVLASASQSAHLTQREYRADVHAVTPWQHQIQQDQVRLGLLERGERFVPMRTPNRLEPSFRSTIDNISASAASSSTTSTRLCAPALLAVSDTVSLPSVRYEHRRLDEHTRDDPSRRLLRRNPMHLENKLHRIADDVAVSDSFLAAAAVCPQLSSGSPPRLRSTRARLSADAARYATAPTAGHQRHRCSPP